MKFTAIRITLLLAGLLFGSQALAQTYAPFFNDDVGAAVAATNYTRDGVIYTFDGECSGIVNCGDYFDIALYAGEQIFSSFCEDFGGTGSTYDPSLAIYRIDDLVNPVATNDDACSGGGFLNSTIDYFVGSTSTYRVTLGTFSSGVGSTYTLAFSITPTAAPVPSTNVWALIMLALLLAGFGFYGVNRRAKI